MTDKYNYPQRAIDFVNEALKEQGHWTQRKDKTFTGLDVIRIWMRWLDDDERDQVYNFFVLGTLTKYHTLLRKTFQFCLDVGFLIQDLFTLQWLQVYFRYQDLIKRRKQLIDEWTEHFEGKRTKKKKGRR